MDTHLVEEVIHLVVVVGLPGDTGNGNPGIDLLGGVWRSCITVAGTATGGTGGNGIVIIRYQLV